MPKSKTLKVRHLRYAIAPMQFSDTTEQARRDFAKILGRGYDVVFGTEVGPGTGSNRVLDREADRAGYRVARNGRYDTWVAVNECLIKRGTWRTGAEHVLDRSSMHRPKPMGRWGDKGIIWAQAEAEGLGVMSWGSVHALTVGGAGRKLKRRSDDHYAEAIARWIKEHGAGYDLAFVGGDWNLRDRDHDLTQGKWRGVSCWDEVGKWPNTGHGNIDAILRSKADTRVLRWVSAEVKQDDDIKLYTDHWITEAVVEIALLDQ